MSISLDKDEMEAAGVKTAMPGLWIWLMCWPLALYISVITTWRNGKTTHDGS